MSDAGFREFFGAMAGSGATLIGVVFVGLSMRRGPAIVESAQTSGDRPIEEALADALLMALLGGFIVSSVAMLPGVRIGYVALPSGCLAMVLAIRSRLRLRGMRAGDSARALWRFRIRAIGPLFVAAAIALCQTVAGAILVADPLSAAAMFWLAVSIVGYYGYVMFRSWMLIGGAGSGFRSVFDPVAVGQGPSRAEERDSVETSSG